jgi:hypothetical protein
MSQTALAFQRLANQHIDGERFETPEAVVRWMTAMQAQDYGQAVWAIGLRTRSATLQEVEQAIADRKMLRTWPMRGTIHFVAPQDARWMLALSAARMISAARRRQEQLDLTPEVLDRCQQIFYDALKGDHQFTRPQMLDLLETAGISTAGQRGYHILWYAAQNGLICIGPMQEKQQTFALLEDWAPDAKTLNRGEALALLAERYFSSHGPATLQDFAWWAGLTLREARFGLSEVSAAFVSKWIDGKEYWMKPDLPDQDIPRQSIHLLPGFDEYLLGYTDRSAVLAKEHAPRIVPGGNGIFRPTLVTNGQVTGDWTRTIKKGQVTIQVRPFAPAPVDEADLWKAAQRYSIFVGYPLAAADSAAPAD